MAAIQIYETLSNEITVAVTGLDTDYGRDDRYIEWYIGTSSSAMWYYDSQDLLSKVSSSDAFSFTNLSSSTTHYIYAVIYFSNNGVYEGKTLDTVSAKTLAGRPEKYYWTYSKQSGSKFNLTADEWNGLLYNINAVRNYKGLSSYSFTYAYSGNNFTAAMYNQAVYAIQGVPGYGSYIYTVSKGDKIYASHLNNLISELNAIP